MNRQYNGEMIRDKKTMIKNTPHETKDRATNEHH